jgi:hypothetical protein
MGSKVGDDHTPAPEGPLNCTPALLIARGLGSSAIVKLFQSVFPVDACNATTLPRKLQQGYFGSVAVTSSRDAIGTNSVVPASIGEPVNIAAG